ncbi:hypothetical protein ACIO3O_21070 [Streptomyces sp. NPDC087440]|uniref:hypothetical protein n=1 Tax=Streptomyces sp. NPDC087440 TaxID=3365790 RepID=UPI0037F48BEE
MEPELVALATAGATTLVQQMATDGWAQVRGRIGRFLSRGNGAAEEEAIRGELETTRSELTAALAEGDEQLAADLEGAWRLRMRQTLAADPRAADVLREILAEPRPVEEVRGVRIGSVHNDNSGTVESHAIFQAGHIGSVTTEAPGRGRG